MATIRACKRRSFVEPGDKFGSLTVIKEVEPMACSWHKYLLRMVLCKCECGKETTARLTFLTSGHTKSCGCLKFGPSKLTHGGARTRLYSIWRGMKDRCFNENTFSYKNYGAMGVSVCDEWLDFEPFKDWALGNGYKDSLTIERKDTTGNYEPNNCTWIPKSLQSRNRRDTRFITYKGQTKRLMEWAKKLKMHPETLRSRLAVGWSVERAFAQRVRRSRWAKQ